MLTISGTRIVLSIPNNNVRKQYYEFMLDEYRENGRNTRHLIVTLLHLPVLSWRNSVFG